jgi:hypothetical protein
MKPNAVGHPLIATPGINEFTNLNVIGFATRKKARVEYNEYLNFNPSDLTPIYVSTTIFTSDTLYVTNNEVSRDTGSINNTSWANVD